MQTMHRFPSSLLWKKCHLFCSELFWRQCVSFEKVFVGRVDKQNHFRSLEFKAGISFFMRTIRCYVLAAPNLLAPPVYLKLKQ